MQLCFLSDPVGQYRISDRGVFDEGEGKGKALPLQYKYMFSVGSW